MSDDAIHFVYREVDPRDRVPFYVGITNDPNMRHSQHMALRDKNHKKAAKIIQLQGEGVKPRMEIVETVYSRREAEERERYWIQFYLNQGIELTNIQYVDIVRSQPVKPAKPARVKRDQVKPRILLRQDLDDAVFQTVINMPHATPVYEDLSSEERAALWSQPQYTFSPRMTSPEPVKQGR